MGKVEVDAVIEMFQQLESLHELKFENYLGDCDSKRFNAMLDSQPYAGTLQLKRKNASHVKLNGPSQF